MEMFTMHRGRALCIRRPNIDTDQIIPSRFCKKITRTGYADALFGQWREEEGFVLNDPLRAGASVLIAGENFGIGSSREHAVWALHDYGFKAVIATGFGEIFQRNALINGLLPIVLTDAAVAHIATSVELDANLELTVDLRSCTVRLGSSSWRFEFDERARNMILNGLDEISCSLSRCQGLNSYEHGRLRWMPEVCKAPASDGAVSQVTC